MPVCCAHFHLGHVAGIDPHSYRGNQHDHQVEQEVRNKLTVITEASGILQEYPEVAQAITDFVHFANIVIERKKGHEFTSREDKDENDKELIQKSLQ